MLRMNCTLKYQMAILMLIHTVQGVAQVQNSQEEFVLHENSQITYNKARLAPRFYKIVDGDALVFEFKSDNAGEPGNESYAPSYISFQIPNDVKEFEYTDAELEQIGAIYVQHCRCQDWGVMVIEKGTVKGVKRRKNEWDVEFDFTITGYLTGYTYRYQRTLTEKLAPSE
jgi:hypothetical protein